MAESKAGNRIEYIDIFRSFGIILMIMGHVGFTSYFDHFIHAFHMPMFFFVSGFFFKSKSKEELSVVDFLKKKIKTLLIPYLSFGILHFVIYVAIYGWSAEPILHLVWINTDNLPIAGALWFLSALFFSELIYFLLDRYIKCEYIKVLTIVIFSLAGCLSYLLPFTLPFGLSASLSALLIYYAGQKIKKFETNKHVQMLFNLPWYLFIIFTTVTFVLIFVNGYINMRTGSYGIIPLFYINVLLSVIVLINLAKYMFSLFNLNFPNTFLFGIGRNSIVYLSLNQLCILLFKFIAEKIVFIGGGIGVILSKLFVLLCSLVILYFFEQLFTKTKLKFMIGK